MPERPGELMTREKLNFERMTSDVTHPTKLFLESEFQHKGNKQTKKCEFSADPCGFLDRKGSETKIIKYYTEEDKNKIGKNCHH